MKTLCGLSVFVVLVLASSWGLGAECSKSDSSGCQSECEKGNAAACNIAGRARQDAEDYESARELFRLGCEGAAACGSYGYLYKEGIGVEVDPEEALKWFDRGCTGDDSRSCNLLAFLYYNGVVGTAADPVKGCELYAKSCKLDDPYGCRSLAVCTFAFEGSVDEGLALFLRACDLGHGPTCFEMSAVYKGGMGVDEDPAKVAELLDKACTLQVPEACYELGLSLSEGEEPNTAKAKTLFTAACELGLEEGCDKLNTGHKSKGAPTSLEALAKECEDGNGASCNTLGERYDDLMDESMMDNKKASSSSPSPARASAQRVA